MQEDIRLQQSEPAALNFLRQRFTSAKGFDDAQYILTTEQILQKVVEHTGKVDASLSQIYDFLVENGFREETLSSDMTMVWVMKDVE